MKIKLFFLLTTILIAILNFQGCKKPVTKPQMKGDATADAEIIFAVNVTNSVKGEIKNYLDLNGDVKAKTEVDVYPDAMGILVGLNISIGTYVSKNQEIGYVDPSKPGMTYSLSPIKSPISGTVTSITGQLGLTVSPQLSVAKVGVLTDINIVAYVSEKYISKIKLGLLSHITFEAYPGAIFKGKIQELSPVVDPQTRMMEVRISLVQKDARIKPGMFAKIKIITESKDKIVKIPSECVVKRYGESFVFIVKEDGVVEKRKVVQGIQIDNKVEIVEGLESDEKVVIRGQTLLEDKSKVKIIEVVNPLNIIDNID
ncbi:MAG TPA: efflux RND transporter periplasmic adaptor subunit [Spirochaetota bacterium]|nr:efflux RND transporter periplasmic adaptor subunit [Spirochaetota bacterium]